MSFVFFVVLVALAFDFINGFHDAANSIATVVGTRVLTPKAAVAWAAFFNFVAAFSLETRVAKTIGKDIVNPAVVDPLLIFAALFGAIVWNLLTWWWRLRGRGRREGRPRRPRREGPGQDPGLHRPLADAGHAPRLPLLPQRNVDLPAREARAARQGARQGAARLGGRVLVRARDERRAADDGHHRRAPVLVGAPEVDGDPVLDRPHLSRGDRPRDADGRVADRADDGNADHAAQADRRLVRRVCRGGHAHRSVARRHSGLDDAHDHGGDHGRGLRAPAFGRAVGRRAHDRHRMGPDDPGVRARRRARLARGVVARALTGERA